MNNHEHKLDKISLLRITKVQLKYSGTSGDKAFLFRKCECGYKQAFEYGNYKAMLQLGKQLNAKAIS